MAKYFGDYYLTILYQYSVYVMQSYAINYANSCVLINVLVYFRTFEKKIMKKTQEFTY